ncbi:hypothetical protein DY000_02022736 [Brassica cretica]|uniref:Uncharacterized protein n=1 Tax=Brassica cretica TaxID=69181 RepID=A0ABQ7E0M5_BRACR|nr:hypothetical protein DY000_02022736 [Brassica cretica]
MSSSEDKCEVSNDKHEDQRKNGIFPRIDKLDRGQKGKEQTASRRNELAQAVRSLVLFFQSNYVRLDSRKGYMQFFISSRRESVIPGKVRISLLFSDYGNRRSEFRFPQFGARRRGGVRITLTHSRKTLDQNDVWKYERKNLHNNAGKTTPAATAPMANAYANATVLE